MVRKYGLDDNTIDFIGHALALHRDDRYLNEPAYDTVKRMKVLVSVSICFGSIMHFSNLMAVQSLLFGYDDRIT